MKKNFKFYVLVLISLVAGNMIFSQDLIRHSDLPDGFASFGIKDGVFGADGTNVVTVSTGKDFKEYAEKGGYLIYVEGKIDITDGYLPENVKTENELLGKFINERTEGKFSTWKEWRDNFAKVMTKNSDYAGGMRHKNIDKTMDSYFRNLVNDWSKMIQVRVGSNTTIIGADENAKLCGASLQISGNNIAIRNLTLQDAFDPFPHHEAGDGWNAQYDSINIAGGYDIWIDHVTFQDTISVGNNNFAHVKLGDKTDEKWQTSDGFLDMNRDFRNITVSYCHFYNHDKTSLIGSSDKEQLSVTRTVTMHHNYFHNCVQRLPMIRLTNLHLYNNYFDVDKKSLYKSSYAIGARYAAKINSEENYFGSGIAYSMKGASKNFGAIYSNKDTDKSSDRKCYGEFEESKKLLFEVPYAYTLESSKNLNKTLPALVGAGILKVEK